ncbi:pilin [Luteimonas sp. MJ246]|uniref:pilin n=1 Tax=Luteimonas sp. MJ174 TaxID=3129237 RepID=UPI0031BB652B
MKGFTLIELMIAIAIIAIVAAIALPAYQDYVARAQVTEGLSLATGAKTALATYYGDYGLFPPDNASAGMAAPNSIVGRHISSVTVGDRNGLISVSFSGTASAKLHGQTLIMQASDNDGSLRWECGGLDRNYLPSSCS